jgi:hypothetical protein
MRHSLSLILAILSTATLLAQGKVTEARTMTQFGAMATVDQSGDWGGGFEIRNFWFIDPIHPDGLYVGFLSGTYGHTAGGVSIGDCRLVSLGWRGDPLVGIGSRPTGLQLDLGLAPTWGTLIEGNSVLGTAYLGVGFTVGLAYPVADWGDLGLAWEPTFNVTTWGAPGVPQKSYHDFLITWTIKRHTETKDLAWR